MTVSGVTRFASTATAKAMSVAVGMAHPRIAPDGSIWNIGLWGDKEVVWSLDAARGLRELTVEAMPLALQ